ncbi:RHS repeat-associated core domain-containing protein [Streptomyces sp. NPDC006385]|uniref:RHS repeat-associated core domain-containing protein n=1 Tax=Streptomyces sp. NPDC006385 TaxID=3156761 RepID=UPI00339E492F
MPCWPDPETGLHYNFHRHYDPANTRYTSPDPLGLTPAPNPVARVHNSRTWVDPSGLAGCEVAYGRAADEGENLKRWAEGAVDKEGHGIGYRVSRTPTVRTGSPPTG